MANTLNISITTPKVWTEVFGTAPSTGKVSIAGNGQHCILDSVPSDDLIGHRFTGEMVEFTLTTGEALYVRADSPTTVIVTQD